MVDATTTKQENLDVGDRVDLRGERLAYLTSERHFPQPFNGARFGGGWRFRGLV